MRRKIIRGVAIVLTLNILFESTITEPLIIHATSGKEITLLRENTEEQNTSVENMLKWVDEQTEESSVIESLEEEQDKENIKEENATATESSEVGITAESTTVEGSFEATLEGSIEAVVEESAETTIEGSMEAEEGTVEEESTGTINSVSGGDAVLFEENPLVLGETAPTYTVPDTADACIAAIAGGQTEFTILDDNDWLQAQEYCALAEINGFSGITLKVLKPEVTTGIWSMEAIEGFVGIGTKDNPFKGTLSCSMENGLGIQIHTDKPIVAYLGAGGTIRELDIDCEGSSAGVAGNISGEDVVIDGIWLRGTIGTAADTGTVGIIAQSIEGGSSVEISDVILAPIQVDGSTETQEAELTVTGAIAGGIAGTIGDNASVNLADSVKLAEAPITLTGSEAVGGYYGIVTGSHTWNLANQDSLNVSLVGSVLTCYMGGFAGKMMGEDAAAVLAIEEVEESGNTSTANHAITVNMTGFGSGGGLIGYCDQYISIEKEECDFTISGNIDLDDALSGGVVAHWINPSVILSDYVIKAKVYNTDSNSAAGGLVGKMEGGKCIIRNITIPADASGVNCPYASGGLIGRLINAGVAELQGDIEILYSPIGNYNAKGWLVGLQEYSFVYWAEPEALKGDGTYQYTYKDADVSKIDEFGAYGGAYRNQKVGDALLIGDGTLEKVGVLNNTISAVTEAGENWYVLNTAADFESLAIVLGTNGNYGTEVFGAGVTDDTLLAANYKVTGDVDISREKTGIISLNRNAISTTADKKLNAFSGKMKGPEGSPVTITQNVYGKRSSTGYNATCTQRQCGLFSYLAGDPVFENLILSGTVEAIQEACGLAYQCYGSSLTLNNFTVQKEYVNCYSQVCGVMYNKDGYNAFSVTANNLNLLSSISSSYATYCGFIYGLNTADVEMKNVKLGGTIRSFCGSYNYGASFIGYSWSSIGGIIENISVENGTEYSCNNTFGVLFNSLTNNSSKQKHVTLDTIKLNGLTVNAKSTVSNCSLLICDGNNLVADIIDYDSTGCEVNNPGPKFDEVVGKTKSTNTENFAYSTGIISLHETGKSFPEFHYENKVSSLKEMKNSDTIYFYDLFQYIENEDGSVNEDCMINGGVIDTPQKMLLWDAIRLSNGNVTFKKYLTGDSTTGNTHTITLVGDLDLSGISFYPITNLSTVTYKGTEDATITFGAENATVDMSTWTLANNDSASQHYTLQGGLFCSTSTNAKFAVSDLTLAGKVANLGVNSGALICGPTGISNISTFSNITLDNLWIADYTGASTENTDTGTPALLISKILKSEISFEGIRMENYPANSTTKAAGSLIGTAGSSSVTDLVLHFHDMKIADDVDGNDSSNHNSDVLAYASFLYYYCYTDDTTQNKGSGIYLFSEQDNTDGKVTYGLELDNTTEFSDTSNKLVNSGVEPALYKPYVYTNGSGNASVTKKIAVNPKTGDILKGCGTYEDPYLIENARQLLTLYRFINETGKAGSYTNESFYAVGEGWKIVKPGNDSSFCTEDGTEEEPSRSHEIIAFTGTETNFPTPEELSRAYYRLEADIDLSAIEDSTYKMIADEFMGFGIKSRPFVGVWYGKGTDGEIHTITLPDKSTSYANYGFIQFAKGTVVKDLNIATAHNDEENIDTNNTVSITDAGGSVIGVILGGDNIIDNVTVSTDFIVGTTNAEIGGYVGVVKKGGLILRGIEGTELASFRLNQPQGNTTYPYLGALAGKVEDGFVVYEGVGNIAINPLWDGNGGNTAYPVIPYYDIINADKLKADSAGLTTTLNYDPTDGHGIVSFNIPSAAALQVMAMAMNSDTMNIYSNKETIYTMAGYNQNSRTRKASYVNIGQVVDETDPDYIAAVKYDNVMGYTDSADAEYDGTKNYAYPYLYDFMGIGTDYAEYLNENGFSVLNPGYYHLNSTKITKFVPKWYLAEGKIYDLRQYGKAFRGIGVLYEASSYLQYTGVFRGSLYGNNSTVLFDITREFYGDDANNTSMALLRRVGLFNSFYGNNSYLYDREMNFKDVTTTTDKLIKCFEIKDLKIGGSIKVPSSATKNDVYAGGIVGFMQDTRYVFENITMSKEYPLKIGVMENGAASNIKESGGLVGRSSQSSSGQGYYIKDCDFSGTEEAHGTIRAKEHCGGLIGYSDYSNVNGVLNVENTKISYMDIYSEGTNYYAGGLVGYATKGLYNYLGTQTNPIEISHCNIQAYGAGGVMGSNTGYTKTNMYWVSCTDSVIGNHPNASKAGGIVGWTSDRDSVYDHITVSNVSLSADGSVGGICGEWGYNASLVKTLTNLDVSDLTISELDDTTDSQCRFGGLIGYLTAQMNVEGVNIHSTIVEEGNQSFTIATRDTKKRDVYAGGVIGYSYSNQVQLKDCVVDGIGINLRILNGNTSNTSWLYAGGLVGYLGNKLILAGEIATQNMVIDVMPYNNGDSAQKRSAGGFVGYKSYTGLFCEESDTYSVRVFNNLIRAELAGGLMGRAGASDAELNGVKIDECIIEGDEYAGGVVGYLDYNKINNYSFGMWSATQTADQNPNNVISDSTIIGNYAGGYAGYVSANNISYTGKVELQGFEITNNKIVTRYSANNRQGKMYGGGIVGYLHELGTCSFVASDIYLQNNEIYCEVAGSSLTDTELNKIAVGGVIGKMTDDSLTRYGEVLLDNIHIEPTNQIGVKAQNTEDILLVKKNANSQYELSAPILPVSTENKPISTDLEALAVLREEYGYFVGSVVGVNESKTMTMYMIMSDDRDGRFEPITLNSATPVVDVGRNTSQTVDAYRGTAHIIYGAKTDDAESAHKNIADMKAQIEKQSSTYDPNTDTVESLVVINQASEEAVEMFTTAYVDGYTFGTGLPSLPMLRYRVQDGSFQEFMEHISDVMTNVAGADSSDMGNLEITFDVMKYDGTEVTVMDEEAYVSATITDRVATFERTGYSTLGDGYISYIEATYTYSWVDTADVVHEKVFKVPIFVEEPILYSVHSAIIAGKETSVAELKEKGDIETKSSEGNGVGTEVYMTDDSDYTLLLEYTYGQARTKMNDSVYLDKVLYMKMNAQDKSLPIGTELVLIDVTHGNRAYYYKVEQPTFRIRFTDFKDSNGNNYVNSPIHQLPTQTDEGQEYYTDLAGEQLVGVGVERYLLQVLCSTPTVTTYNLYNELYSADNSIFSRFQLEENHPEETIWNITAIKGLTMEFDESATSIGGMISDASSVKVKAGVTFNASTDYWSYKTQKPIFIDSENAGRYVDIAFYLEDSDDRRYELPRGTNISYEISEGNFSNNKALLDTSVVYYYKDIRNLYELPEFQYMVDSMNGNTTLNVAFDLSFSGADLSGVIDENYMGVLELRKTTDKEYPTEVNSKVDEYRSSLNAVPSKQFGFGLRADKLETLGINTYPKPDASNTIPCHVLFDFGGILNSLILESDKKQVVNIWKGYDYQVTYQIYQKVSLGGQVSYEPYTGEDIVISATGLDGLETESVAGKLIMNYQFSAAQIEDGYSYGDTEKEVEGLISLPCKVTQNTQSLVTPTDENPDALDNLTNYKLLATLVIKEPQAVGEVAEQTEDFLIYTVTKLKIN